MTVIGEDHAGHPIFGHLDRYISFYDCLAMSVFSFSTPGTRAIGNIDSYVYSSMLGTLASIAATLKSGRLGDAYALLRRYHDSAIINIYSNLFLHEHFGLEQIIVHQINDWLLGKVRLPEYRVMSSYIRASTRLEPVNSLLYKDDRYKTLRNRCNDYTHYNFFQTVLLNDSSVYLESRAKKMDEFLEDARDLFILHIAYLFYLNDHYMASSDYVDALDCGLSPAPNSQYWVAPFVQEAFSDILAAERPDIAAVIKAASAMEIA